MSKKLPSAVRAEKNIDQAKDIVDKFVSSLTWRTPYKNKWDRYYKMYRGILEEKNYPWQSNIFVPLSFSTVETVVPRLVSNRPQIDVMPREANDQMYADLMNKLIDYQWDVMGMNTILPDAVKEMCIYGTVILKVYWKKDTQKVHSKEPVDDNFEELGVIEVAEDQVVYDAPCAEIVDLYDFFWDPRATTIDDAQWVIHRTTKPLDHIKEKAKEGIYKNVHLLEGGNTIGTDDEKSVRRSVQGVSIDPDIINAKNIELLEYWTDDRVVVVANRGVVIRDEKNPYNHGKKPFIHCVDQRVPHEFLGIGELEPIESLQYELNDRRNQRMDNVSLVLNKMFKVVNGRGIDEDELISRPGGVVHMTTQDALDVMQTPDVTASSYQEETLIKSDIQQTTGVTDFSRGMASDALANDTATGISLLQEASNARFRLKIQNIEDMALKRLGEFMISMNVQFITDDQKIRIVNEEEVSQVTIPSNDLRGNLDAQITIGSTQPMNDIVNRKQVLEMYQMLAPDPSINQVELKKYVFKQVFPKAPLDKIFAQEQQQMPMGMPTGTPGEAPQLQQPQQAVQSEIQQPL